MIDTFSKFDEVKKHQTSDRIFLAGGTSDYYPQQINVDENIMRNGIIGYEDTRGSKALIETYFQCELGTNALTVENVIPTCGATAALYSALRNLCHEGDHVLILMPSWSIYRKICLGQNLEVVEIYPEDLFSMRYSIETIQQFVDEKTRAVIVASPANPTSKSIDHHFIQQILDMCFVNNIFLILDETYYGLQYHDEFTALDFIGPKDARFNNLIVIRSLSKYYCSPGLRVGFVVAATNIIDEIHEIARDMYLSVPNISQQMAISIITSIKDTKWHMDRCLGNLEKFRQLSIQHPSLQIVLPDSAFFITFRILRNSNNFVLPEEILAKTGIVVRSGAEFGIPGYCRINISCERALFEKVIMRMELFLQAM